ncbi:MAG: PfkB family carbohydrate kinase [Brachybacterium sp.]|nr:PfkB family carbohydrate kinase [Brachybacterium sp.]
MAAEDHGYDRSFLSSLGAMGRFNPDDVPVDALQARFVLCSGYFLLPGMQGEATGRLLAEARRHGAVTAVDTGHPDGGWSDQVRAELFEHVLPHTDLLLPNESELVGLTGIQELDEAARHLSARTGATVVAKLGANGAMLCTDGQVIRVEAPRVEAVDTTGAGDAFNAAFLAALHQGNSNETALSVAVRTASELVATAPQERAAVLRGRQG